MDLCQLARVGRLGVTSKEKPRDQSAGHAVDGAPKDVADMMHPEVDPGPAEHQQVAGHHNDDDCPPGPALHALTEEQDEDE